VGYGFIMKDMSFFKDVALPLAALMFTVGQLWHTKENQEFEKEKHAQDRKDKYWDKRLEYFHKLNELVGTITYNFTGQDSFNATLDTVEYKNTKICKIYTAFGELEYNGEFLFNNPNINDGVAVVDYINEIKKGFEIIRENENKIFVSNSVTSGDIATKSDLCKQADAMVHNAKKVIDTNFKNCNRAIFSYLKV